MDDKTITRNKIKRHRKGSYSIIDEESLTELSKACKSYKANDVATIAVKRFRERWRKAYGTSIKHWLIPEIGTNNTRRVHLHGILWTNADIEVIGKLWKYGNIKEGQPIGQKGISYITKYITKTNKDFPTYRPKILTSPGIGSGWELTEQAKLSKFNGNETNDFIRTSMVR